MRLLIVVKGWMITHNIMKFGDNKETNLVLRLYMTSCILLWFYSKLEYAFSMYLLCVVSMYVLL